MMTNKKPRGGNPWAMEPERCGVNVASVPERQWQDKSSISASNASTHDFDSVDSILRRALGGLEARMTETFDPKLSREMDAVVQEIDEITDEQGKEGLANVNG